LFQGSGWHRLIPIVLGVAFALGTGEAVLRVLRPQSTLARTLQNEPAMFRPSDVLPYELRAGYGGRLKRGEYDIAIRIDGQGYRSPEFSPRAKKPVRILAVGDSFTFGWGVEADEAYPQRLERLLAAPLGADVEVINAGFAAGYSPDTYYLFLKKRGMLLNPDLIVIGFFVGNDIDHVRAFENEWTEVDGEGLPLRILNVDSKVDEGWLVSRRRPLRYEVPVLRDLHLFQLAAGTMQQIAGGPTSAAERSAGEIPFVFRVAYEERTRRLVEQVQRLFRAMKRVADERRVPLCVLLIPDRDQLVAEGSVRTAAADWDKPQRLFRAFFDEEKIPYLDLLAEMRAANAAEDLYIPNDFHWNRNGHALAARRLAEYLFQEGLVNGFAIAR
jgi:lysophospholipase L1-like esterase